MVKENGGVATDGPPMRMHLTLELRDIDCANGFHLPQIIEAVRRVSGAKSVSTTMTFEAYPFPTVTIAKPKKKAPKKKAPRKRRRKR